MNETRDSAASEPTHRVAAVVIGRNEGDRLVACLESVRESVARVVYVDSGSTDNSVAWCNDHHIDVVELDLAQPFTAARARNAGYERCVELFGNTDLEFVQFLDGDCLLDPSWIGTAVHALDEDPELAVVCGRRRERFPNATVYNRLCDIEWNTPVGRALACGGDALFRRQAFEEVGGYHAGIIAGEEPELCVRLTLAGWAIERLDAEMTLHDAAMTRFSQWWKRSERAGHSYAEGFHRHGRGPTRHFARDVRSITFWAGVVPVLTAVAAAIFGPWALALLGGYPLLASRVFRYARSRGFRSGDAALYAASCVVAKAPQAIGALRYHWRRLRGTAPRIIEYKSTGAPR